MDQVALLKEIERTACSGEALAARFGVSRAMIWKGIEALRAEGLTIEASREGYRLREAFGAYGPTTLSWALGTPVRYHASCPSTNAIARELGREGVETALVVADHQASGRGRRGRRWESPAGKNLMFSWLVRPDIPPQHAPRCVLQWAAAMAQVLDVRLKWPNDLVGADGAKLGGLLAELEAEGEQIRFIVLGVGININQKAFPPALSQATSLAALRDVTALDRATLLRDLMAALKAVDVTGGDLSLWRSHSRTLGRRVRVNDVEGVAEDIRADGALIVGGVPVLTGDVELIQ
ncbi:MAG: biotin--[acetyl-CoA-carboxylase] ligase [Myxococcota bacterium]